MLLLSLSLKKEIIIDNGGKKLFLKKIIHIHDFAMSNTLLADAEFTCLTYGSFLFGQIFAIFDFFFQSFCSVFTLQSILLRKWQKIGKR